ncbi:hypothetical protein A3Q56_00802 [Intoshia linei]|uniref:HAT C-terminal dimerisation domain-containing protein n=1 Tax=Intoshia linei TaxID=1819745 RepID=A0A177BAT5_9BILA|nr:hypothetical protein A3Q56_00802 [Intoshia linei]
MILSEFWCSQINTHPKLSKFGLEKISPFPTTYLCEKAFSTMLHIKSKTKNRLG